MWKTTNKEERLLQGNGGVGENWRNARSNGVRAVEGRFWQGNSRGHVVAGRQSRGQGDGKEQIVIGGQWMACSNRGIVEVMF